jgi:thymidine phosphorylase
LKKVGDSVSRGEPVGLVLANEDDRGRAAVKRLLDALVISESPPAPRPLIIDRVEQEGG